jgi:hypothetical protein
MKYEDRAEMPSGTVITRIRGSGQARRTRPLRGVPNAVGRTRGVVPAPQQARTRNNV